MLLLPIAGHSGEYPINRRDSPSSTNDEGSTSAHRLSEPTKASAEHLTNPMDRLATEYDRWFDSSGGKELFGIEVESLCCRSWKARTIHTATGTVQSAWSSAWTAG